MPLRNSLISRLVHGRAWNEWDEKGDGEHRDEPVVAAENAKPRSRRRRLAVALAFGALFVAGAAFSAAAGDQVRSTLEDSAASGQALTDGTTTAETSPASTDPVPAADPAADGGSLVPTPAAAPGDSGDSLPAPGDAAAPPPATAPVTAPAAAVATAVQEAATQSGSASLARKPVRSKSGSQRQFARTMRSETRQHHFPKRDRKSTRLNSSHSSPSRMPSSA